MHSDYIATTRRAHSDYIATYKYVSIDENHLQLIAYPSFPLLSELGADGELSSS